MLTLKRIFAVIAILAGIFFVFSIASDIQLGFGLTFIFLGVLLFPVKQN